MSADQKVDDGGLAFARPGYYVPDGNGVKTLQPGAPGMTYRAWAAGRAMQGFLHGALVPNRRDGETNAQATARLAVAYADALVAELKK